MGVKLIGLIPRFKPKLGMAEFFKIFLPSSKEALNDFKKNLGILNNQKYIHSYSHGRIGLYACLKALEIKESEIICPAYTCIVMAHAIVKSENIPVFVDASLDDFNMDTELIYKSITDKTRAIIFTSLFGNPCEVDIIEKIRKDHPNILIIQDLAHGPSLKNGARKVSSFADLSLYALGISKPFTSIFGGMVSTNSEKIHNALTNFNEISISEKTNFEILKRRIYLFTVFFAFQRWLYPITHFFEINGFINRFVIHFKEDKIDLPKDSFKNLSTFEAEIGNIQLKKLNNILEHNQKIAKVYKESLKTCESIVIPKHHSECSFSHFNILIKDRKNLTRHLLKKQVQPGQLFEYYIPQFSTYSTFRFNKNEENNARKISKNILNLPLNVSEIEAQKIATYINNYYL